jgi:hypothetical protein
MILQCICTLASDLNHVSWRPLKRRLHRPEGGISAGKKKTRIGVIASLARDTPFLSGNIDHSAACQNAFVSHSRFHHSPEDRGLQRFNLAFSGVMPLLRDCTQSLSSACGPAESTA